jgi:HEPN domain-containing protein
MSVHWHDWLEQAGVMLGEVRNALDSDSLITVAFFSQQVAEQSLKALWLVRGDGLLPHTHDLMELAEGLEVPEEVRSDCQLLNPLYTISRYPDAANGLPARNFNTTMAAGYVAAAERVNAWCASQLHDQGHGP